MSSRFIPPSECPVCGATVPRDARACPECGADERSGWNEDATRYDGLDLPDQAFEDARQHEPAPRQRRDYIWLFVSVALLLALILTFVFRR